MVNDKDLEKLEEYLSEKSYLDQQTLDIDFEEKDKM